MNCAAGGAYCKRAIPCHLDEPRQARGGGPAKAETRGHAFSGELCVDSRQLGQRGIRRSSVYRRETEVVDKAANSQQAPVVRPKCPIPTTNDADAGAAG